MSQPQSTHPFAGKIAKLLRPYPRLSISQGDMANYNVFRHREPSLVSIIDSMDGEDKKALDALVLNYEDKPLGVVSYLIQTNEQKGPDRNMFARIDLVITADRFRNQGVGRALLMCVMVHLLHNWQDKLYSISCLAAHEAIRKTLEGIGFVGEAKENLNYVQEELKLDERKASELAGEMAVGAGAALKIVNFHFRQRGEGH